MQLKTDRGLLGVRGFIVYGRECDGAVVTLRNRLLLDRGCRSVVRPSFIFRKRGIVFVVIIRIIYLRKA